jgi:abequosyltransferase
MLSIAIPTFNRNTILQENLKWLLPQLTEQCQLLILDNCSTVPVQDTLSELLAQYPDVKCQIIRNPANIGGNANILRCIELCSTPWVWVLGDDDRPLEGAIERIFVAMEAHADCSVLNFSTDTAREKEWTARGVEELAQTLDGSADLPWISSSVYRAEHFKTNLKFGYQYIYSMLPHVAVMLVTLGTKGTCFFSRERIIDAETRDAELEQQWSVINLALGVPVLFDLPLKPQVRTLLAEKLMRTNLRPGNGLRNVAFELLMASVKQRDYRNSLYYFDQICLRLSFNRTPRQRLEGLAYRVMLRYPRLSARLYRLAKGHPLSTALSQDRFGRM